jgi:chromosome segregation ATPase
MKNVSKAEMSKEIKRLQLELESADRVGTKYATKIRDLEAGNQRLYDLGDEYRKEIKRLRQAVAELGGVISEKNSEIKDLREMREGDDELHAKKSKKIHELRAVVRHLEQKRNENDELWQRIDALQNVVESQRHTILHMTDLLDSYR